MTTAQALRPHPCPYGWIAATLGAGLALGLAACAGPVLPTMPPGKGRITVQGDQEVIANCLASVSEQSVGGPATLRVDRARQQSTLRREAGPGGPLWYELRLRQIGAATVEVEADPPAAAPQAQSAYAFLWSQIEVCAVNRMAP